MPTHPSASELAPFCGIHKVGGYGYQLPTNNDDDNNNEDEVSCFPSSQESSTSSAMAPPASSPPTATKKRSWSVGSDDLLEHINTFHRESMSPPLRPLAQPKTRIRRSPPVGAWGGCGQDGMEWEDFEEAPFLQPEGKWDGTGVLFG
ncbi:hypothetical protein MMC34_000528 [Xylographa carneopallida]|nr:hypothetical protein [Xylographa carneopallida]